MLLLFLGVLNSCRARLALPLAIEQAEPGLSTY